MQRAGAARTVVEMARRVLVIIPCLNERDALPVVLAELRGLGQGLPGALVPLVIDDGSDDDTARVAASLGARAVRLCANLGIGGAVQAGLRVAATEDFDYAVQLDGDGQHPAEELVALLAPLEGPTPADLVVGTRFLRRDGFQSTPVRRLGIRWLSLVLRLFARLEVTDPTSGFRAYGRRALRLFVWRYPYDYPEPEALALARRAGLRVVEVPVTMRARVSGQSSIRGLGALYYMLKVTLAILLDLVRNTHFPALAEPSAKLTPLTEHAWSPSSAATGSSPPAVGSSQASSSG